MTPLRIALAGLVSLAVAMGVGRFAFTPILPMMLRDGGVTLPEASWLATANYLGYLVGALLCTFDPWLRRRLGVRHPADGPFIVRAGLAGTALATLAMALPSPAAWPALRFAAGVISAYVLLHSSAWCLAQLAVRGAPQLGGVMFVGPGAGIVVSGLLGGAMVSWHWPAAAGWAVFALLAALPSAAVWRVFDRRDEAPGGGGAASMSRPGADDDPGPHAPARVHGHAEIAVLAFAYGIAGFGYIITATFLPVIAREAIPGSPLLDLFWPLFGIGIVLGALISSRIGHASDRRHLLAGGYAMQAAGIALGILWPGETGFGFGSLLLGLPFTTLTLFALQEVRRLRPRSAASVMGLVTSAYALGQLLGPPLVTALLHRRAGDAHAAFQQALTSAAGSLLLGAAIYLLAARVWPLQPGPVAPVR